MRERCPSRSGAHSSGGHWLRKRSLTSELTKTVAAVFAGTNLLATEDLSTMMLNLLEYLRERFNFDVLAN